MRAGLIPVDSGRHALISCAIPSGKKNSQSAKVVCGVSTYTDFSVVQIFSLSRRNFPTATSLVRTSFAKIKDRS